MLAVVALFPVLLLALLLLTSGLEGRVVGELAVVRPRVLVLLGATAAQALLGSSFRVSRQQGEFLDSDLAPRVLATIHPSSILRAPDEDARALAYKGFVADLGDVTLRLSHSLEPVEGGGTSIVHRLEIGGPAADRVGPELGPAITEDFP